MPCIAGSKADLTVQSVSLFFRSVFPPHQATGIYFNAIELVL